MVGRNVDGFDDPFIDADADAEALAVAAEAEADAAAEEGMVQRPLWRFDFDFDFLAVARCSVRRPPVAGVFPSVRQESPTVHRTARARTMHHEIGFT